ncbi:uncharacterized protein LOC123531596 [Mercenaria mercenaria]|uniref:uncharacterized protein LOC123531596 n=1 Tax=Mercenaria mercenaria TaxID=6596 RepID=UPI00234F7F5D|nr:uncharacterized protein LOC123531596 [Mercenaria mercenaria]XP_045168636.2 uncharacterized protein LOC123531596 [Mercenaria mercenaria]XP_053373415.1 uncharacterized protein LOC123531596 [Mercenaria mercenaria]
MDLPVSPLHVDLIVKFGGSAVTDKTKLETLDEESLRKAAELISQCYKQRLTCIVVHGAGSFGHHQAKEYNVNSGWVHFEDKNEMDRVKRGFCLTRKSVTMLNQHVVNSLLQQNIPAVGLSVCGEWVTEEGTVVTYSTNSVRDALRNGFIPVLHGDCVLDRVKGCNILSGDTIIRTLSEAFKVNRVVFLTSVKGVYNCPPENNSEACLLKTITVGKHGNSTATSSGEGRNIDTKNEGTDVTGGMTLKFQTAVGIARDTEGKTKVFICMIGSRYATAACLYGANKRHDEDDSGTEIIFTT